MIHESHSKGRGDHDMTVHIAIDSCSDVTWGYGFEETRRNCANLVAAHLDRMRSDPDHRYNSSVFVEFQFLCEVFPERRQEAIEAVLKGSYWISPFLNNTLYGWQSIESQWRTLWHARQLERELALDLVSIAEHIELPSLPWSQPEVLAAAGIKRLFVPFYAYLEALMGIKTPPVFDHIAPSGRRLRVHLDRDASVSGAYWQGQVATESAESLREWSSRYAGEEDCLASGMHADTLADSYENVNAMVDQLTAADAFLEDVRVRRTTYGEFATVHAATHPEVPEVEGDLGCSWEGWLVSLADLAAKAREAERAVVRAEALLAAASAGDPSIADWVRQRRDRTTWLLGMLADHAWNGLQDENRRQNVQLRRDIIGELHARVGEMLVRAGDPDGAMPMPSEGTPPGIRAVLSYERDGQIADADMGSSSRGDLLGMTYEATWREGGRLHLALQRPPGKQPDRAVLRLLPAATALDWTVETGGAVVRPRRDLLPGAEARWTAMQYWASVEDGDDAWWIASADAFLVRHDLGGIQLFGNDINPGEVTLDQGGDNAMRFRFAFRRSPESSPPAAGMRWARETLFGATGWPIRLDEDRVLPVSAVVSDEGLPGSIVVRLWEATGTSGPMAIDAAPWTSVQEVDLLERPVGPPQPVPRELDLRAWTISAWRFSR